jgi:hypothetical protein
LAYLHELGFWYIITPELARVSKEEDLKTLLSMTRETWPLAVFSLKELQETLEVLFSTQDFVDKSNN